VHDRDSGVGVGAPASRQHKFDWLRGDWSEKKQSFSHLPVDAYSETGI
jgi:hypothetical protein